MTDDGQRGNVGDDLMRQMGAFFQNSKYRARSSSSRSSRSRAGSAPFTAEAPRLSAVHLLPDRGEYDPAQGSPRRRGIMPPHISAVSAAGLNRFSDSESDGEQSDGESAAAGDALPSRQSVLGDRASVVTATPRESDDWSTDIETTAELTREADADDARGMAGPSRATWVGAGKSVKARSASAPAQHKQPFFQFGAACANSGGETFVFGQPGLASAADAGAGRTATRTEDAAACTGARHSHSSSKHSLSLVPGPAHGAGHRRVASTPASSTSSLSFAFDGGASGGSGGDSGGGSAGGSFVGSFGASDAAAHEALAALVADAASPGHWLTAPTARTLRRGSSSSRRGSALASAPALPGLAPRSCIAPGAAPPRVSEVAAGASWLLLCAVHGASARAILQGARESLAAKRTAATERKSASVLGMAGAAAGGCSLLQEITHLFGRKPGDPEHEQL